MQTTPCRDTNFYNNNIRDETACMNKYAPVRKLSNTFLSQTLFGINNCGIFPLLGRTYMMFCCIYTTDIRVWVRVSFQKELQTLG